MEVEVDAADGAVVFFEAVDYGSYAVVPSAGGRERSGGGEWACSCKYMARAFLDCAQDVLMQLGNTDGKFRDLLSHSAADSRKKQQQQAT